MILNRNAPLPYTIEYSKAARSTCKKCRRLIAERSLRMSRCQPPSTYYERREDAWFHFGCFWSHLERGTDTISVSSVHGVDWLCWDDQEQLRNKIQAWNDGTVSPEPEPEPETQNTVRPRKTLNFSNVTAEKSLTNRGKCSKCGVCFEKGEIKMLLTKGGGWWHAKCFFAEFDTIHGQPDEIPNWTTLDESWRQKVDEVWAEVAEEKQKSQEPELVQLESDAEPEPESESQSCSSSLKRTNTSEDVGGPDDEDEAVRAAKKRKMEKAAKLAEVRKSRIKKQADRLCEYRKLFEAMSVSDRLHILRFNKQDWSLEHDNVNDMTEATNRLVDNAYFGCPIGCLQCPNGKITYSSSRRTYICTGYATEYSKCTYESPNPIRTPFRLPENIARRGELKNVVFNESSERLYMEEEGGGDAEATRNSAEHFIYAAEAFDANNRLPLRLQDLTTTQNTHIIKQGTVVDAKCLVADQCHVLKDETDGTLFQATLSFADITLNKNSFYKIQLLKHDFRDIYYLFRSWGRVGTEVGDCVTETQFTHETAIKRFEQLFFEKTKNEWKYRKHFRKIPGFFNYVETDFSDIVQIADRDVAPGSKTLLPKSVKEVVMSIFDVENMKSALKSFEMDVNKMPLGRLSRNQINLAFGVLTELSELLAEYPVETRKVCDATNKFYTIIPHNFGMRVPEPIDSFHKVKEKNNMLNALLDIKFAYDQIYGEQSASADESSSLGIDPVDTNYRKLNCSLVPLERGCRDWQWIAEYMTNTQGSTHDINVQLIDILKVERIGESEKFMGHLSNRKLLWHGSGRMNFAGILGQGLRIAPPEAPVSGYMFGKGVYFADMFSKSFFYCRESSGQNEAYMLLCDVALGGMHQLSRSASISASRLPNGTHSVKGVGRECPCPTGDVTHEDGYVIPKGKRIVQLPGVENVDYTLLYNEYIVYNVDQIQLKYLVRIKVNWARHLR